MTQVQYGDAIYENLAYAQRAAISSYLTASGQQAIDEEIYPHDTPLSVAADMMAADWRVPGIDYQYDTDPMQDLADVIDEHFGDILDTEAEK